MGREDPGHSLIPSKLFPCLPVLLVLSRAMSVSEADRVERVLALGRETSLSQGGSYKSWVIAALPSFQRTISQLLPGATEEGGGGSVSLMHLSELISTGTFSGGCGS